MNKAAYLILSFCCALTLLLAWVVYGQTREIESLTQRTSDLEDYNYWHEPRNEFIKRALTGSFGFQWYENSIERTYSKKYFSDRAYKQYLDLLDEYNISEILENDLGLRLKIEDERLKCFPVFHASYYQKCIVKVSLWRKNGRENTKIDLASLRVGYKGGAEKYIIADIRKVKPTPPPDPDKVIRVHIDSNP